MSAQKLRTLFYLGIAVLATKFVQAQPAPISNLTVGAAGFKHLTISWNAPYDIAPTSYAVHISSYRVIVTTADWENNSADTAYPYRIYWTTTTATGQTEFLTITQLTNNRSYFLAIRSSTDGINWSDIDTTSPEPWGTPVNSEPDIVVGHNPADGTIVNSSTPTLTWSAPGAGSNDVNFGDYIQSYTLWYSTISNFSIKSVIEGIPTNSYITPPLDENTTYYWRVYPIDSEGLTSATVLTRKIIINAINSPPTAFSLTYPVSSAIVNTDLPTFQWTSSSDIDPQDTITYTLIYSTDINFNSVCSTTIAGLVNNYSNPTGVLMENFRYWWYVKAIDSQNSYTLSNTTETFWVNATNDPPQSFSQVLPASSTVILISRPTFYWEIATDPDPADTVTYTIIYSSSDPTLTIEYNFVSGLTTNYYYPAQDLVEDATYWWKIQATDTKPQTVETPGIWSFIVNAWNAPPNSFNLLTPSGTIITDTPTFIWENNGDLDGDGIKYNLYYSTDVNFSVFTSSLNILTSQFSLTSPLTENATYYWKVIAYDTYANSTTCNQTFILRINTLAENPLPFDLINPANGENLTTLYPSLWWQSTSDPDPDDYIQNYTLFYSSNSNFFPANSIITPNTYYNFGLPLNNRTTYYWYVRAVSAVSGDKFSNTTNYFVIKNVSPNNFNLLTPSGTITTNTPQLFWQNTTDPDGDPVSYTVYYSTDINFSTYSSSAGITTNNFSTLPLTENTTYYWKVVASDPFNNSTNSTSIFKILINALSEPPADFNLISPKNTSIFTRQPQLVWQSSSDPDPDDNVVSYNLYLWKKDTPAVIYASGLTQTNYTLTADLDLSATYYWNVVAIDTQGLEKFSTTAYFYIAGVLHPAPVSFTLDVYSSSVTVKWNAVTTYEDGSILTDLSGYSVYRAASLSDLYTITATTFVSGNQLSWTDTNTAARSLYYLVRARDIFGTESIVGNIAFKDYSNIPYQIINCADENIYLKVQQQLLSENQTIILSTRSTPSENIRKAWEIEYYSDGQKRQKTWETATAPEINIQLVGTNNLAISRATTNNSAIYQINWFNGIKWVPIYRQQFNSGEWLTLPAINSGEYQMQLVSSLENGIASVWPKIITPKNADGINDEFNVVITNPELLASEGIIYDLSGGEVSRMKNKTTTWFYWDGKDENNQICLPGVYLYQIKIGNRSYNGTLVVAQ